MDEEVERSNPPDRTLWLNTLAKVATAITAIISLIKMLFINS